MVGASIQFKCLSNGTKHDLNGAGPDASAVTIVAMPDLLSKSGQEFNTLVSGDVSEYGIHSTEWLEEYFLPMAPIVVSLFVICCHDSSVGTFPLSLEKTHEAILLLKWKMCHESFCRGEGSSKQV